MVRCECLVVLQDIKWQNEHISRNTTLHLQGCTKSLSRWRELDWPASGTSGTFSWQAAPNEGRIQGRGAENSVVGLMLYIWPRPPKTGPPILLQPGFTRRSYNFANLMTTKVIFTGISNFNPQSWSLSKVNFTLIPIARYLSSIMLNKISHLNCNGWMEVIVNYLLKLDRFVHKNQSGVARLWKQQCFAQGHFDMC